MFRVDARKEKLGVWAGFLSGGRVDVIQVTVGVSVLK